MTTLDNIEKLIKREKATPDRIKPDSKKSSNEILSELFSAFNADPPKIEDIPVKKSKKSKKKHKKEKKKRSRSSSSSDSDTDYSHKKKKKKVKTKSKKHKEDRESPHRRSRTPIKVKVENKVKKESKVVKENGVKKEAKSIPIKCKQDLSVSLSPPIESFDASLIPMPDSPKDTLDKNDLCNKLDKKNDGTSDNEKAKGKIQIKNLKFSAVFEETVKKAEEEARKKAEKVEEGECTASSSSSSKDEDSNSHFPKSSDPGGILKKAAADTKKIDAEEERKKSKSKDKTHKCSQRDRSRSRKRSPSKSRRSRSRSTSRRRRHRSRSRSSHRRRRSRSRRRSDSKKRKSRSGSRSHHRSTSDRHRQRLSPRHRGRRSRSPTGVKLADSEKKRLLEVARRNAINMLKNGAVPAGAAVLPPHTRNQVMAAIQSGGKSVDELTDFCKHLSKKEALGELSSVSSNDDNMSENEDTLAFHHPFLVKEKAPIVMNIRGGVPLAVKPSPIFIANKEELTKQFPVSSGTQHREKASDWVPVSPKNDDMQVANLDSTQQPTEQKVVEPLKNSGPLALPPPPAPSAPAAPPAYLKSFTTGCPYPEPMKAIMEDIVLQKLSQILWLDKGIKPRSVHGNQLLRHLDPARTGERNSSLGQEGVSSTSIDFAKSNNRGDSGCECKDQLVRAAPVEGGMGMHLLQKMGWTPGQGLGKEGTGTLQPLLLEVKLDTKGLQAKEEINNRFNKGMKPNRICRRGPLPLVAGGKHPVSLLGEYCSKQKLGPPEYNLCFECGPDHKKNFLFRVKVAGIEYQPAVASANKKQAKADAAQLALQKLGIVT
ncbi:unnamed protein product [Leptidea sinapis]|uniref:G-patch domain-containing protein n=1 Tax=Leptidea sinapis TaxID=189913 RepID=A0A5E4R080_9NEOP|nr:unnamed protein product [Leptidea sinapis]